MWMLFNFVVWLVLNRRDCGGVGEGHPREYDRRLAQGRLLGERGRRLVWYTHFHSFVWEIYAIGMLVGMFAVSRGM